MFKEGDLVEYNKQLYFIVATLDNGLYKICPVNKIELFGTELERLSSILKYSIAVFQDGLKLNESGTIE